MGSAGDEHGAGGRRRGRPPGQSSEETWARILRAARQRFSQTGYARTSLADIAREAGITPRAIYHYVDSKPQLFAQAAEVAYARWAEEVTARVLPGTDTGARLHGLTEAFRVLYREDPTLVAFLSQAAFETRRNPELDVPMVPRASGGEGDHVTINRTLVSLALVEGGIAPDVDADGAAALLEVLGAGLTLLASDEREDEYMAMLDVLDRVIDGTLFVDRP
jgi:TetR/AcrR family transcriptional regulator, repressor for uid operon